MGNDIAVDLKRQDAKISGAEVLEKKSDTTPEGKNHRMGEILVISSYPPRECGIATYSQNLLNALNNRFVDNYAFKVCAVQPGGSKYYYPQEVVSVLDTTDPNDFDRILKEVNSNEGIHAVIVQHEFGLFKGAEHNLVSFIMQIEKPLIVVFHTVIANPNDATRNYIGQMAKAAKSVIVLASVSERVLKADYNIPEEKVEVIPYGTHLVTPAKNQLLKEKYGLTGKVVLLSIGLLSPGKGIETILKALPSVIKLHPEIMFLVVGKTHPEELKTNGEKYRIMLESKVKSLKLQNHVQFLNVFSSSETLQEYFQLSDISIFSSTDQYRPMSGMFAYAVSCGNVIISSATPHAYEFLGEDSGLIYNGSADLVSKIITMLDNPHLRKSFSESIQKKSLTALWENSALVHNNLFNQITGNKSGADINYPPIKLDFVKKLTDRTAILHSTYRGEPDLRAGYTLDDNALALFLFCMHYKVTGDINDLPYISKYLKFIYYCYQPSGEFFKYVDYERRFTHQNYTEDMGDTQAKAIWALGYLFSMKGLLPAEMTDVAALMLENTAPRLEAIRSGKSIALAIKGLYYYFSVGETLKDLNRIKTLANKLVAMYKSYSTSEWKWFEPKFSEIASILPGALLNTWLISGDSTYRDIARESFEFLSSRIFDHSRMEIKSTTDWAMSQPGNLRQVEKPSEIAFAVITLSKFYLVCKNNDYFQQMDATFKWFLGNNRLKQMVYNPVTGSCFDGLDDNNVMISQSAESALSYNLARLIVQKYKFNGENHTNQIV